MAGRDNKALAGIEEHNNKILQTVIKKRQQEAYQSLQEKALNFIQKKSSSFATSKTAVRDAAIALDIAVKGERQVLGLSDVKMKGALVKDGFAALVEIVMAA